MERGKTIEVLLASYNGEKYISQQLDSILDQTVPGIRILVSDDGSTDGTAEILRQYAREYPGQVVLLDGAAAAAPEAGKGQVSAAAGGPEAAGSSAAVGSSAAAESSAAAGSSAVPGGNIPAPARNFFRLMAHADADYILLSDQDDVWIPEKAERLLERIRGLEGENGGVPALVFSDMEVVDESLNRISPSFFSYAHCDPDRLTLSEILAENPVTGGALMMNRPLLELARRVPEACCMHDWWIALAAVCFGRIACVREALYFYRQHGDNSLGARRTGSLEDLAGRPGRQAQVEENYRRMFDQAAALLNMYGDRLTKEQRAVVKAWLAVPDQAPFARLRTIRRYHFYKSSFAQTLAQCVTIPRWDKPDWYPAARRGGERAEGRAETSRGSGTVCVILNYNDAATTEDLVRRIRGYGSLDHIVVVDNASADDSFARLAALQDRKVTVIRAEKNGGYGAGNNLGVRFAAETLGAGQVLIANPDVEFSERCVRNLAGFLRRNPQVGAAAAVMDVPGKVREDGGGKRCRPANVWRLHGFLGELVFMGPVSRRLFAGWIYYPAGYFAGKKAARVDAVHGSMLMVNAEAFMACGGYDENIFPYQEEMVLAGRMRSAGYVMALLPDERYIHRESVSISRSVSDALARQRLRETSVLYYMERYLGIGPVRKAAAKLWFAAVRAETRVYLRIPRR